MRLALILLVGLALRLACALRRSFWIDEFHTYHHATASDLGALLAGLVEDNHPPLWFLLARLSHTLFGDGELALRLPSLLCGLGIVYYTARLARWFRGSPAALFAPLLVAVSSLQVVASGEARMYALTGLAVAGLLDALARALFGEPAGADGEPGAQPRTGLRAAWPVALWTSVGLHAHYFFLHFFAVLALGLITVLLTNAQARSQARSLWWAAGVTTLLSAPWYLYGFYRQFFEHDLVPGGLLDPWGSLPRSFVHLEFHNAEMGGSVGFKIYFAAAALLLLLVGLGALRALGKKRGSAAQGMGILLIAVGIGAPVWSAFAAWLNPRMGFNWLYLAPATAPFALLAAYQGQRHLGAARAALIFVSLSALSLSVLNVIKIGPTEDYRAAIGFIIDDHQSGDAIVALEPAPKLFPPSLGWETYAPWIAAERGVELPAHVPLTQERTFVDPAALDGVPRAYFLQRGIDANYEMLRALRAHFGAEEEHRFGYSLWVHRFTDPN